jgi:hypothetical protein
VTDVADEIARLPQKHSELWDVFKTVKGSGREGKIRAVGRRRRARFYES